jgi:catechol 2,3-dioxygenase-like lactoylglutathione lyase family enzyme
VLADADLVAFVASTDLAAAEGFYGGVLGLELVDAVAGAAYTVLGWRVEDLDAAVAALRSRGVEPRRYEGNGA